MAAASTVLPYADVPQRWGIACAQDGEALRVTIPPTPGVAHLGRGLLVAMALVLAVVLAFVVAGVRNLALGDAAPFFVNAGIYGFVLFILALVAWDRLRRRIVIAIDHQTVRLTRASPGLSPASYAWPRQCVREIKLNRGNGKLLIRITGADLVELYVSPCPEVTEWVAHVLGDALQRPAPESARSSGELCQDLPPPPMKPGAGRTAMLAAACVISLLGIVVFVKFGLIAIYVFAAAGVPAGIALGSQKKEYWI